MNLLQCFDAVGWVAGRASGLSKTEWWGAGVVICMERCADLHMAQLMPLLLTVSCFSKIQIGSTFLVPSHLGSPGKRAVKRMCVIVCLVNGMLMCVSAGRLPASVPPQAQPYSSSVGLSSSSGAVSQSHTYRAAGGSPVGSQSTSVAQPPPWSTPPRMPLPARGT